MLFAELTIRDFQYVSKINPRNICKQAISDF